MSNERTDSSANTTTPTPPVEANGAAHDRADALAREVVMLRARCSNLRHWCLALLGDPAADGVLPAAIADDLRTVPPEITEAAGHSVIALLAQGGSVPPTHPLAPGTAEPAALRAAVAAFSADRERLRQVFFSLYDTAFPGDVPTEQDLLAERETLSEQSISDLLAQLERGEEAGQ